MTDEPTAERIPIDRIGLKTLVVNCLRRNFGIDYADQLGTITDRQFLAGNFCGARSLDQIFAACEKLKIAPPVRTERTLVPTIRDVAITIFGCATVETIEAAGFKIFRAPKGNP